MTPERLNTRQFDLFSDFIYAQSGIRIESRKVTMLSNRIRSRVNAGGFENFDSYYRFLTSSDGQAELSGFLSAITTNETYFFRTLKHFDWFRTDWVSEQIDLFRSGKRDNHLRVLSAGCASGAEAYSLGICFAENGYRLRDWTLQVLGTDISDAELVTARAATFKSKAIEHVTERQRKRFFRLTDQEDKWQVRPLVQKMVEFKTQNLMNPIQDPPFDCIFLRNVLIYFDPESKRRVLKNLIDALAPGGYLVTGPSEGVYGMLGDLQRVNALTYRKSEASK